MNRKILPRFFLTILLCIAGSFLLPVYAEAADNKPEAKASARANEQPNTEDTDQLEAKSSAETADQPKAEAYARPSKKHGAQSDTEVSSTEDGTPDSQQQIIITSIADVSYMVGYAIPVGTDWDEFFAAYFNDDLWQNSVTCETTDGRTVNAHVTWSNPQPNTSITQMITLTGTVILPDTAILADGVRVSKVRCTVSIQSADNPSLDSWYINYGTITFPWITDGVTERNAVVMYRQDGSDWSTSKYFYCDDQAVYLNINCLSLGSYYEIQVVWDGGSTNIFSFTYDGSVSINYLIGGDRDGGDAGGSDPSDVSQLPPDMDAQDNQNDSVAQDDSGSQPQADSSSEPEPQTRPNAGYQTPSAAGAEVSETENSDNNDSASDSSSQSTSGSDTQDSSDSQSSSDSGSSDASVSSDGNSSGNNSSSNNSSSNGNSSSSDNGSDSGSDSSSNNSSLSSNSNSSVNSNGSTSSNGSDASGSNGNTEPDDTFMETITDTYSLISGTRLNLMRQNGSVRFSKQGITVTLSDAALDALDMTDDSQFYIEIRHTENGFSLLVELDGQFVTELPDTIVMLPCDAPDDGSVLTLKDSDGSTITGSYDDASGIATFTVQHSGVYTLTETLDDSATAASGSNPDDTTAAAGDADADSDGSSGKSVASGSDSGSGFGTSVASGSDFSASAAANSANASGKTVSQLRIRASATAATVLVVILAALFLIPLCHKDKSTGSKPSRQRRKGFRNTATSHPL